MYAVFGFISPYYKKLGSNEVMVIGDEVVKLSEKVSDNFSEYCHASRWKTANQYKFDVNLEVGDA